METIIKYPDIEMRLAVGSVLRVAITVYSIGTARKV
jgi:hypothetical protein